MSSRRGSVDVDIDGDRCLAARDAEREVGALGSDAGERRQGRDRAGPLDQRAAGTFRFIFFQTTCPFTNAIV